MFAHLKQFKIFEFSRKYGVRSGESTQEKSAKSSRKSLKNIDFARFCDEN